MEMDPSFVCPETGLLLRVRAMSEGRGGRKEGEKNEGLTEKGKELFKDLCMHSTFLIYSSISPLNN